MLTTIRNTPHWLLLLLALAFSQQAIDASELNVATSFSQPSTSIGTFYR